MEDWQQRVVDEQAELANKITKLEMFFQLPWFEDVRPAVKQLMREQHRHMVGYNKALLDRIALF
jgi:uncharacterized protein